MFLGKDDRSGSGQVDQPDIILNSNVAITVFVRPYPDQSILSMGRHIHFCGSLLAGGHPLIGNLTSVQGREDNFDLALVRGIRRFFCIRLGQAGKFRVLIILFSE